jgi:ketosteroid isomerase-like protein
MSEENVERLRRAYEAFSRGDLDGSVTDAAPDMEYVSSGIPGVPKVSRGPEGYKEAVSWLTDWFDDSRLEAKEFLDAGDKVLGEFTLSGRGKQSGVETSVTLWQVWTLRDGKFVHGQGFASRAEALEAAGLSE